MNVERGAGIKVDFLQNVLTFGLNFFLILHGLNFWYKLFDFWFLTFGLNFLTFGFNFLTFGLTFSRGGQRQKNWRGLRIAVRIAVGIAGLRSGMWRIAVRIAAKIDPDRRMPAPRIFWPRNFLV